MCSKAERSAEIAIGPPRFDFPPGILDRQELIGVETFIALLPLKFPYAGGCGDQRVVREKTGFGLTHARRGEPRAAHF
jgi:hypothetical protein